MTGHAPNRWDHLFGALLAALYLAVLLATVDDLGLSRDESMYVYAADSYGAWYELLWDDPKKALEPASIARHFRVNREHPALAKTLFAFAHMLDEAFVLFPAPSTGYRVVGMLCAALLLWLIYAMGVRHGGRSVGAFAALAYALLPRPFYHAHLDCFDVPITLAITAVVHAYARALLSRRWVWLCGLAFGLALATKHNSWVLPGIFGIHFLFVHAMQRRQGGGPVARVPYWLLAMALIGPVILVGTWPFLWHDGLARFGWYARFHLRHEYYNMAYFGVNYFLPPFPIGFPWVMTLFTVPLTTLLLAGLGLWQEGRGIWARLRLPEVQGDPAHTAVLWLGCLLAPMLMISLPSSPIFGGTKHWMTAYPFLCLFAGVGFAQWVAQFDVWLTRFRPRWSHGWRQRVWGAWVALGAWLLMPAMVETAHSHPFALSHYGVAAGGVPGAADLGMNRQFWGYTTGSLVGYLNATLPEGGRVYVCDMTASAFEQLAKDGLMRRDIKPSHDIAHADLALVHHEHHFAEVDYQIWTTYGAVEPATVLTYDGVPIISVYRNPRSRREGALRPSNTARVLALE